MAYDQFEPRVFYNDRDQEVRDNMPYAAIVQAVVEIIQAANFKGPVESNGGFTILGVPIGGGSGDAHVIEDEGTPLTARAKLNFVGTGVVATDDSGDNASVVTINAYVHPNHSGDVTSVGDGAQTIANDAVTTVKIANLNVTTGKLADGAVTDTKLASDSVTTVKILADNVTNAKLANMAEALIKGRAAAAGTGDPQDLTAAQVRTIINVADGANAYVHPNHSGDVTSVGDGAQTIAADAVSNSKLANMAESTVKGRAAGAGTGDPTDLTPLQLRPLTRRAGTVASSATPSIDADAYDFVEIEALATDITSVTVTGTPTRGQRLWLVITGTATRAITLGASFEASTIALPTTTDGTNTLDLGFRWNTLTNKWRLVAKA